MTTFDNREKEFEQRFKHDQDFRFKITARRNRMLGLWAAERMGLAGAAPEVYARTIVEAQLAAGGDNRVVEKIIADLAGKGETVTAGQVRSELERLSETAKQQLMAQ